MIHYGRSAEIRRLITLLIVCLIVGLMTGFLWPALVAGTLLYTLYHLHKLHSFNLWLQNPQLSALPDGGGLWGQALDSLGRQKRRESRERNRLKGIIERINATTAAINDAVVILDPKNMVGWWNQAAVNLLDLKPADAGTSLINYIRHPKFVSYLEAGDYELPLVLPSPRNHDVQLEFQLTRFGDGEALMVVRDITRIYKLEQMRKDFVANVSHELRTPLTVIRGYLETLDAVDIPDLRQHKLWQQALEQMQQQTARMTSLVNDLTVLSKLETDRIDPQQQSIVLRPILDVVCAESRAISGEQNHRITLHCAPEITVVANERELHSALSNLVTNAVKYSSPENPITVSVNVLETRGLEILVEDRGIGIEPQHLNRLTERFYRVDDSRSIETGGTGLGLAIVKHILLRHDARLEVRSEYGQGSCFRCVFPAYRVGALEGADAALSVSK